MRPVGPITEGRVRPSGLPVDRFLPSSSRVSLLLWVTIGAAGCAGSQGGRGSYIDHIRVDRRPPLVDATADADSLYGPRTASERGDGIAESRRTGLERMVRRFTPTLVLPPNDHVESEGRKYRLIPTNVTAFADTLRLDRIRIAPYEVHDWADIPLRGLEAASLLALVDSAARYWADPNMITSWYFDFPGGNPKEWWRAYARLRAGPEGGVWAEPTVYAHPYLDVGGRVVIQYWYFFPFNDYIGNHEGDWEHVNVVLSPDRSSIDEVHYFFHQRSVKLPQGKYQPTLVDTTHPVVYLGGRAYNILDYPIRILAGDRNEGSHGCYPFSGEWEGAAGLGTTESVKGADGDTSRVLPHTRFRTMLTPEPSRISYHEHPEVLKEWAWLLLPVRWGFPTAPSLGSGIKFADVGNVSPFGPAYNTGWNRTAPGLLYPGFRVKKIPTIRAVLEDLVQPWYYLYIFRYPRYVHDPRGSMDRGDLERLGLAPLGGWQEIGIGSPILGAHFALPQGSFSDDYGNSMGFLLWRNFWGKLRVGSFELMGGYQRFCQSGDRGSLFVFPITANLTLRTPDAWVRPYITAGGGVYGWESRERLKGNEQRLYSGWDLGWTVGVGLEYYLRPRIALDLGVRQHFTGIAELGTVGEGRHLRFLTIWIGHYLRF
jgi:hypothetical protein